jgi:predicted HNH restriction endonuclease
MGGVKNNRLNRIDNLFPVCRSCHDHVHRDKSINEEWKVKLLKKISDKEWKKLYNE